jgi:branched-chain amino acid transport system permease protein
MRTRNRVRLLVLALVLAGFFLVPVFITDPYWVHVLTIACVYAILAASWDLLYGIGGLLSFGQAAFFGVGGYTAGLVNLHLGLNPWLGLIVGGLGATVLGLVFSFASVRLRGTYLALSTLALAQTMQLLTANFPSVTNGTLGLRGYDPLPGLDYSDVRHYYAVLIIAVLAIGTMFILGRRSRTGLAWRAMRNDPVRASTIGISVPRNRLAMFTLSAFAAGVAGAFYADYLTVIAPAELDPSVTANIIAMAIIGGSGTLLGPAAAAIAIETLSQAFRSLGGAATEVALGFLIIVFVLVLPGGFSQLAAQFEDWVYRVIARRRRAQPPAAADPEERPTAVGVGQR